MTCEKQRHYFVAQLSIVHSCTIVVLRLQQHRQQITLVRTTCSALSNDAKHYPVDFRDGLEITPVTGCRQPIIEDPLQRRLRCKWFHDFRKNSTDVVRIV